jgi:hypothetical protein
MTTELIRILSDFFSLILDWNFRLIPTEEEFLFKLNKLKNRLSLELEIQIKFNKTQRYLKSIKY